MNPFSGQIHNIHYKQYFDFKNSFKKNKQKNTACTNKITKRS